MQVIFAVSSAILTKRRTQSFQNGPRKNSIDLEHGSKRMLRSKICASKRCKSLKVKWNKKIYSLNKIIIKCNKNNSEGVNDFQIFIID